jgi:hypothetical protein
VNLKETIPSTDTDGSEQLEDVEYFNYLGRKRANNEGYTSEIESKITTTPWSRVLPEKLERPELLKKFPAFYGTRRFITAFTTARHLSLS